MRTINEDSAKILTDKAGRKYVQRRMVSAFKMDEDFELVLDNGQAYQGAAGDYVVYDLQSAEIDIVSDADFKEMYKLPRDRKKKDPKPSRPTLEPTDSN